MFNSLEKEKLVMFVYTETWFRELTKHKDLEADVSEAIKIKLLLKICCKEFQICHRT